MNITRKQLHARRGELESICRQLVARDLRDFQLYIVANSDAGHEFAGTEIFGCTMAMLDLVLKPAIGTRWGGRGGAIFVDDLAVLQHVKAMAKHRPIGPVAQDRIFRQVSLAVAIHETAHLIGNDFFRHFEPNPLRQILASRMFTHTIDSESGERTNGAGAFVPWLHHEHEFIRTVLHLAHRCREAGHQVLLADVFDSAEYELSSIWAYAEAIGDEPAKLAHLSFEQIRATPAPSAFVDLWAADVNRWIGSRPAHPETNAALDRRERFIIPTKG